MSWSHIFMQDPNTVIMMGIAFGLIVVLLCILHYVLELESDC